MYSTKMYKNGDAKHSFPKTMSADNLIEFLYQNRFDTVSKLGNEYRAINSHGFTLYYSKI